MLKPPSFFLNFLRTKTPLGFAIHTERHQFYWDQGIMHWAYSSEFSSPSTIIWIGHSSKESSLQTFRDLGEIKDHVLKYYSKFMQGHPKIGLGLFWYLSFRKATFRHGHFIVVTCRHKNILALVFFGTMEVTTLGHFGTWTFWHMDISALHRGAFCQFPFQWIYYCHSSKSTWKETGKTHLCALWRNVYIALHSAKMYMCQNVHVLK